MIPQNFLGGGHAPPPPASLTCSTPVLKSFVWWNLKFNEGHIPINNKHWWTSSMTSSLELNLSEFMGWRSLASAPTWCVQKNSRSLVFEGQKYRNSVFKVNFLRRILTKSIWNLFFFLWRIQKRKSYFSIDNIL